MDWSQWAADTVRVAQGHAGETRVRQRLIRRKIDHMQVDLLFKLNGHWNLAEIKNQERFVNPDGHGLPLWQVEKRMEFFQDTGIPPWLIVVEPDGAGIFAQRIDVLESKGRALVTQKSKRVIYPIASFIELPEGE